MELNPNAIHEAGHAVVAWIYGEVIETVTICGPPGGRFHCLSSTALTGYRNGRELTAAAAMMLLAGGAGAAACGFAADGMEGDLAELGRLLLNIPDPETATMRRWRREHNDIGAAAFAAAFLPRLVERLRAPKLRECIEAGAAWLELAGTLWGADLVRLFECTHGAPLPPLARPADDHGKPPEKKTRRDHLATLYNAIERLLEAADALRWHDGGDDPSSNRLVERATELSLWARDHVWHHDQAAA